MSAVAVSPPFEVDVVLRDGSTVAVRRAEAADEPALRAFLERLSLESRALRYFSGGVDIGFAARLAARSDADVCGLVALAGVERRIVGQAAFVRTGADRAEIAFMIADEMQGHGLATVLLAHLCEAAARAGVTTFAAVVLPANARMLGVFRESGLPLAVRSAPGEVLLEMPTGMSPEALERFELRDRTAAAAAVSAVLQPRSVALVGASRRPGTIGAALTDNLLANGFTGTVHLVNQHGGTIRGQRVRRSMRTIREPVDLAVLAVPADAVLDVARDCASCGVRALVVISAGFGEAGPQGRHRQRELVTLCRSAGMRLVGPNCLGVLNTAPDVGLNASFAPTMPTAGNIGVMAQSGGVAIAMIEHARALGVGISSLACVGDKADLSGNDFLQYWEQDDDTRAVLLYLESFGNPRRFARIAQRVAQTKPILAVKSGRGVAGARAAGSHTGGLVAASDVRVDALFRQAGVIRADTMGELLDVAALLASQPLPEGPAVGVVTNAGGPGVMCADALEAAGLELADLGPATRERMGAALPVGASLRNPVDTIAGASAEQYGIALRAVMDDPAVDAVIAIFVPPLVTRAEDVAREIVAARTACEREVPLAAVFLTAEPAPAALRESDPPIPGYDYPEDAVRALSRVMEYASWRRAPRGVVPELGDVRPDDAAVLLAEALADGAEWLSPERSARLLRAYGVPLAPTYEGATPAQAGRVARTLGGEVVLKAVAPGLVHKTDVGAVRTGLRGEAAVRRAAEAMQAAVAAAGHPDCTFLVQPMVGGVEMLVGVVQDPSFGPVVACGAGGVTAELVRDVAVRLTPLTDRDAAGMVDALRMRPLLDAYRGAPPADVVALCDVLLRIGALVEAHPEIAELDCNPVMAGPSGAIVVDVRVRVAAAAPSLPMPSLGA